MKMNRNSLANLEPTKWKPGQSGNLNGRPVGARGRFTEQFVSDIAAAWHKHGAGIVEQMASTEPMRFAELCARLVPKDVSLTLSARLPGNLEPEDWQLALEAFQAIRDAMPDANRRQPGEVLAYVRGAIEAHGARLIDEKATEMVAKPGGNHDA
jgi:hypothetical protein